MVSGQYDTVLDNPRAIKCSLNNQVEAPEIPTLHEDHSESVQFLFAQSAYRKTKHEVKCKSKNRAQRAAHSPLEMPVAMAPDTAVGRFLGRMDFVWARAFCRMLESL
jgi:quinolinate synthase